jgi:hypothetical protein
MGVGVGFLCHPRCHKHVCNPCHSHFLCFLRLQQIQTEVGEAWHVMEGATNERAARLTATLNGALQQLSAQLEGVVNEALQVCLYVLGGHSTAYACMEPYPFMESTAERWKYSLVTTPPPTHTHTHNICFHNHGAMPCMPKHEALLQNRRAQHTASMVSILA